MGCELKMASTCTRTVVNSSSDSFTLPMVFFKHLFINWTILSKNPPCHGAFSKLKLHFTLRPARYCCASGLFNISSRVSEAEMKVLALSEIT